MKLHELKEKATASELTLIEAVEEHFKMGTEEQLEWRRKATIAVMQFARSNPAPSPGAFYQEDDMRIWLRRLQEAIEVVQ